MEKNIYIYTCITESLGCTADRKPILLQLIFYFQRSTSWDFPGGPTVRNPPASAGEMGSVPGPGRFHMPRGNEADVLQIRTAESHESQNLRLATGEATAMRSLHTPPKGWTLLAATRESWQTAMMAQHGQKETDKPLKKKKDTSFHILPPKQVYEKLFFCAFL